MNIPLPEIADIERLLAAFTSNPFGSLVLILLVALLAYTVKNAPPKKPPTRR